MDVLSELIPSGGLGLSESRELINAVKQPAAQRVLAELKMAHRDNRKLRGQAAILREVEQGWHEFPPRQVPGSAKNDEYRRFELVVRFHWFRKAARFGPKKAINSPATAFGCSSGR